MMVDALLGYFCAQEVALMKGEAIRGRKLRRFTLNSSPCFYLKMG